MLLCCAYINVTKAGQDILVPAVVRSTTVVDALTCCALIHSWCDLKAARINVQIMLYEFELDHNVVEETKNICWVKGVCAVDYSTITRWSKKFCSGWKNLNNQTRSGRPKTVDSEVVFQIIEANLVDRHRHDLGKSKCNCRIVFYITFTLHYEKIQNFWITQLIPLRSHTPMKTLLLLREIEEEVFNYHCFLLLRHNLLHILNSWPRS